MIHSKKYNFLYIAVAKTATTLIEGFLYRNLKHKHLNHIFVSSEEKLDLRKHSTMQEIELKSPEVQKYWKFTFVRNPYSRVVSWFSYLTQGLNDQKSKEEHMKDYGTDYLTGDFKDFCNFAPFWVFNNQFFHLCDKDENINIDFIGRFENLQEDFNIVCDKIGIPKQKLPHKNKSKHKHYTEYYDDETREIVAEKYAKDIGYFGYEFGE
jgi:chondroitin 4-sulfotransferase 11